MELAMKKEGGDEVSSGRCYPALGSTSASNHHNVRGYACEW